MAPASTLLLLPASFIAFVSQALADNRPFPIAIKKQSPGSGEKILREHLAFAPLLQVEPGVVSSFDAPSDEPHQNVDGTSRFYPPFAMSLVALMAQHAAEELDRVRPARQVVQRLWAAVAAFQDMFAKVRSKRIGDSYPTVPAARNRHIDENNNHWRESDHSHRNSYSNCFAGSDDKNYHTKYHTFRHKHQRWY
ncbi:uncharacterized protein G6M90_00g074580 [Metarhizium brunneum]|uniref:Uncharacterized protein n=1 Tax=Metarhizium brunneum TaxID=500148 RepID=A0A7D5UZA7_9HYPO|nr:hypothetical protein G6M90_00g074580 [Metarhizium brunneum]